MKSLYSPQIELWMRRNSYSRCRLRAALIDMDGTLYDSMPRHAQAWDRLSAEQGWITEPGEFFLQEGRTGVATINLLMQRTFGHGTSDDEARRLYQLKSRYFNELPKVNAMPGAARMLQALQRAGIERVLVTGSGQSSLIDRLDADFPGAFSPEMRITSRDVTHGKPHPEPFVRAMELARVEPWQAMVIENAPLGVEAGRASGAFTVAVNTGPIPEQALRDAGADIVFPSMESLADSMPALIMALNCMAPA